MGPLNCLVFGGENLLYWVCFVRPVSGPILTRAVSF